MVITHISFWLAVVDGSICNYVTILFEKNDVENVGIDSIKINEDY